MSALIPESLDVAKTCRTSVPLKKVHRKLLIEVKKYNTGYFILLRYNQDGWKANFGFMVVNNKLQKSSFEN